MSATSQVDLRGDVETLTVDGVTVVFGALKALSDVSFTVRPGTVHAVIGSNGAGKSTMFNVLSGVYRASAPWSRTAPSARPRRSRCGSARAGRA